MEQMNNCPVVLYTAPDGETQLDVKLENETVWLSVEQMALLFGRDRTVISRHIRNAYKEQEVDEKVQEEGTCESQEDVTKEDNEKKEKPNKERS